MAWGLGRRQNVEELSRAARRHARPRAERWAPVSEALDAAIAADPALAHAALGARKELLASLVRRFPELEDRHLEAVLRVPRERFVLPEDIAASASDAPLPLDEDGRASVSAPHAYLLTFRLLELAEGCHLLELGTGTGYGAALGRAIVGPRGRVTTIEIDPGLHARAVRLLRSTAEPGAAPIAALRGDGRVLGAERLQAPRADDAPGRVKIAITFAVDLLPRALVAALPDGGRLVAPVGPDGGAQELTLVRRRGESVEITKHGAVRYVPDRGSAHHS